MPRALPVASTVSTSETVHFQLSTGEGKEIVVWQDNDSDVKIEEWRDSNEFPDSNVIQIIRDEMVDSGEEGEDPSPGMNIDQRTL